MKFRVQCASVCLATLEGLNLMKHAQYVDVQPLRGCYPPLIPRISFRAIQVQPLRGWYLNKLTHLIKNR
jgi:hypothetical protein